LGSRKGFNDWVRSFRDDENRLIRFPPGAADFAVHLVGQRTVDAVLERRRRRRHLFPSGDVVEHVPAGIFLRRSAVVGDVPTLFCVDEIVGLVVVVIFRAAEQN
jgi:hypothetical protein